MENYLFEEKALPSSKDFNVRADPSLEGLFSSREANWPRGYKTFLMLTSAEHEVFPAHKC